MLSPAWAPSQRIWDAHFPLGAIKYSVSPLDREKPVSVRLQRITIRSLGAKVLLGRA